jgi:hypothetical protein
MSSQFRAEDLVAILDGISDAVVTLDRKANYNFLSRRGVGRCRLSKKHLVSRETVVDELTKAGYKLRREHTFLPRQYFLEFSPAP